MKKIVKPTISETVKQILSNYPYLDEFLESKCVNFSALAQSITPQVRSILKKDKINKDAVIVSIIRYANTLTPGTASKKIRYSLAKSNISLKTDIMYLNIPKTFRNLQILNEFYSKIKWNEGEILFIVQGISEISVVIDSSNYHELKKRLGNQKTELPFPKTAIIILHSPPEASTEGFIHFITKPIAKAKINIEMLTLTRDTIFLVDEKDASKLFEILKEVVDNSRKLQ
jgi:aspartokinase